MSLIKILTSLIISYKKMGTRVLAFLLATAFVSHFSYSQKISPRFFKKADRFFKKYVVEGQVDYLTIMEERSELNKLVNFIAAADIQNSSLYHKKAFYINAYNILLIKNVIDHFPVRSPVEETGFFSKTTHAIAGDTLTLNEIESLKLIREYKDVRVLFVLSSASTGSVPVPDFAFKPAKLDQQLKKRIKKIVNDFSFIRVMKRSSKILMAESFKRSQIDFNKNDMVDLINKYRKSRLPVGFPLEYYPVNRKLNIKK